MTDNEEMHLGICSTHCQSQIVLKKKKERTDERRPHVGNYI